MTDTNTGYKAVVLDIEGTTTPISFVYDVLFPYARAQMAAYLEAHWGDAALEPDLSTLREEVAGDIAAGVEGIVPIDDSGDENDLRRSVVANLLWQMDRDRKTTALKSIQGKIWKAGYADGELKGVVYDDVVEALNTWQQQGRPVYIYSSGSVPAQKLLFGHSTHGDLTVLLDGYFDTTTGPKKDADSYRKICAAIEQSCEDVVFLTDNLDEARAARQAGVKAYLMDRPGNPIVTDHDFEVLRSFAALL
jgi:enolase-phosphatase E1